MDTKHPLPIDNAFLGKSLKGGSHEPTFSGALSFMRRRYSRDLNGVDLAVWGIPFDAAVSNRPGARFGPQGVRRASAIFCGDPQYPFHIDPFETLAAVDYGDCVFDYGLHAEIPGHIERQATEIRRQASMETRRIPGWIDFASVEGLRNEAREALASMRHELRP